MSPARAHGLFRRAPAAHAARRALGPRRKLPDHTRVAADWVLGVRRGLERWPQRWSVEQRLEALPLTLEAGGRWKTGECGEGRVSAMRCDFYGTKTQTISNHEIQIINKIADE